MPDDESDEVNYQFEGCENVPVAMARLGARVLGQFTTEIGPEAAEMAAERIFCAMRGWEVRQRRREGRLG
jgi:hypothetical protein